MTWWQRWDLFSRQASRRLQSTPDSLFLNSPSALKRNKTGITAYIRSLRCKRVTFLAISMCRAVGKKGERMTSVPCIQVLKLRCFVCSPGVEVPSCSEITIARWPSGQGNGLVIRRWWVRFPPGLKNCFSLWNFYFGSRALSLTSLPDET